MDTKAEKDFFNTGNLIKRDLLIHRERVPKTSVLPKLSPHGEGSGVRLLRTDKLPFVKLII